MVPTAGRLTGIATYKGDLENPEATDPTTTPPELEFNGSSPHDVAKFLYDLSASTYQDDDIRVCAVGGVYSGSSWDITIINKY